MKQSRALQTLFLLCTGFFTLQLNAHAQTPRDQLVIGMSLANVLTLDPIQAASSDPELTRTNVYDTLIKIDSADKRRLLPGLATEWKISDDRQKITLKLRDGVKFNSGNPFSSTDVVWSLHRALLAAGTASAYWKAFGFTKDNVVEGIKATDASTVEIKFPIPVDPNLALYVLAISYSSILDSELVKKNEKNGDWGAGWVNTNSAGSGPFFLREWRANTIIILEKNDKHWRGPPKLNRIVMRNMPESQTQRLSITRGDIDVAWNLTSADLQGLEKTKGVRIDMTGEGSFYYVGLSTKNEHFAKIKVREAILRHLIDFDGINSTIMKYYGSYHQVPVQSGLTGTLENPGYKLDVAKGKALLVEAGYPNGFKTTIRTRSDPPYLEVATSLQNTLAQAGIQAEIISGGGSVVYDRMRDRDYDIAVGAAGDGRAPHPHSNLNVMAYNPDNRDSAKLYLLQNWRASFSDDPMNKLMDAALLERDADKQAQMYKDVQRRYLEVVSPLQIFSQIVSPRAVRDEVKGLVFHPARLTDLWPAYK